MTNGRFARGEVPTAQRPAALDAALTELIDHIAVELAEEYVALMERAATDEVHAAQRAGTRKIGTA